jgi:hypothetical protein
MTQISEVEEKPFTSSLNNASAPSPPSNGKTSLVHYRTLSFFTFRF